MDHFCCKSATNKQRSLAIFVVRIWPGDLTKTLYWKPSTRLVVHEIDGEFCTHALFDRVHGICVRVIDAAEHWLLENIASALAGRDCARVR